MIRLNREGDALRCRLLGSAIGGRMSEGSASATLQVEGAAALDLMEQALGLLDQCDASADIGAHLDLAMCRLRESIADDIARNGAAPGAAKRKLTIKA